MSISQRCDLVHLEKGRMRVKYKESGKDDRIAELLSAGDRTFFFRGKDIKEITNKDRKFKYGRSY